MKQAGQEHPSRARAAVRLYVRTFLYCGIGFALTWGATMIAITALRSGWSVALARWWWIALLAGLFFGAAMSLMLGTLALVMTRFQGAGALKVRQARRLLVRGARDAVVRAVAEVLASLPRAGRPDVDAAARTVEVRIGWSMKSFGEIVTARVAPVDADEQDVLIESRPRVGTTLVDYGANAANADAVVAALRRHRDVKVIGSVTPEAAVFD